MISNYFLPFVSVTVEPFINISTISPIGGQAGLLIFKIYPDSAEICAGAI